MVHTTTRWKWHECLQARDEIIDSDSESESDNYMENTLNTTHQQGSDDEHYETNSSLMETTNELKEEAKVALILSAKRARMQVEIEREESAKKRSSLYDFTGLDTTGDRLLNIEILEEMNNGQLQAFVNDLYCQIEANNDELVNLLIERDSLSMEQDSILVDIEDLTRRLKERSSTEPKPCVYILNHSPQDVPKRSIFHNLFRKTMLKRLSD